MICRKYSETAEFVRNLDRVILEFDSSEWRKHQLIVKELEQFVYFSEKSSIWFMKVNDFLEDSLSIDSINVTEEVISLNSTISNLKSLLIYEWSVNQTDQGDFELNSNCSNKIINAESQDLFRNLKVYDYLIDFIYVNKEFLIKILNFNPNQDPDILQCIKSIRKTFKRIFKVLEYMVKENRETQNLLWKYKEDFIFKELGSKKQEGELDFVYAIIDDSPESIKFNQNKWNVSRAR